MKCIVYLNSNYEGAEIRYNPNLSTGTVDSIAVMEVEDLPERISVKAFHPDDSMDSQPTISIPRDAFVNLLRYLHANDRRSEAITLVRSVTYWSLKESKDFVESL